MCLYGLMRLHSLVLGLHRYRILISWPSIFAFFMRNCVNRWSGWFIGHQVVREELHQLLVVHCLFENWAFFINFQLRYLGCLRPLLSLFFRRSLGRCILWERIRVAKLFLKSCNTLICFLFNLGNLRILNCSFPLLRNQKAQLLN